MNNTIFFILILSISLYYNILNAQWIQTNGPPGGTVNALTVSGTNIFAATVGEGVFISTNNGQNWNQTSLDESVLSLYVSGLNIFAGTFNGVYRTTNNGQNWIQTSLNNKWVYSLVTSGTYIFAGTGNIGIYLSTNNGQNWTQTSLNNRWVNTLAVSGSNIFAGTIDYGVYKSTNYGQNWTQTSLNNKDIHSLAIIDFNVFAGTNGYGVLRSTNNGLNWIQTSLNSQWVLTFAVSGVNIVSGTWSHGIYTSTDNGVNWVQRNEGLNNLFVMSLCISDDKIFAGCYDSLVWKRSLPEIIGIKTIGYRIPNTYKLYQNYPNPFNPVTKIKLEIPLSRGVDVPSTRDGRGVSVRLVIFDMLGKEVATLVNEKLKPGSYEVEWDASNYPSGIYFYKLNAGNFIETKKMVLIK